MIESLSEPMAGDGCRAELFDEQWREPLKAACAEDGEIWQIYANNFGPQGFDESIALYRSTSRNRTFVLFEGDELAGMSSFLGIDTHRGVVEIGGTYLPAEISRHRLQPARQGHDAAPCVQLRLSPYRVSRR